MFSGPPKLWSSPSRCWSLVLRKVGEGDTAGPGRTTEPCGLRLPPPPLPGCHEQRRWIAFFTPENLSSEMGLAQDMSRETLSQGWQGPASGVGDSPYGLSAITLWG